jgi:hypothetical protein
MTAPAIAPRSAGASQPPAQPAFSRFVRPGQTVAHLFPRGAGWSRCLCRALLWTAALQHAADEPVDADCAALGAAIESASESEKRAWLGGDR